MNKKSIAVLVVASCFASSAFATSVISKFFAHSPTASSRANLHKAAKQTQQSHIDFSGKWTGDCGFGETFDTVIESGENYISFNDDFYSIGKGLQGRSRTNEENNWYDHISLEWSKDGSGLTMNEVGVYKENTDNSPLHTALGTINVTMKNGQINIDGKMNFFEDGKDAGGQGTLHCVLTRKQQ